MNNIYIGQELNSNGTFEEEHAFFGDISRINLWDYALVSSDISRLSQSCTEDTEGNLLPWTRFVNGHVTPFNMVMRNSTCPVAKGTSLIYVNNIEKEQ